MAIGDNPRPREQYGAELKRRREAAGQTQEQLSRRAVMSRKHIAHIEAVGEGRIRRMRCVWIRCSGRAGSS